MHSTPRLVNRAWLLVLGTTLTLAGVLGIAWGAIPHTSWQWATEFWTGLEDHIPTWWAGQALPGVSWGDIVLLATAALIVTLLVALVVSQAGGRSRDALVDQSSVGRITVAAPVVQELLTEGLEADPRLGSARVRTFTIRGRTVLRVSVTPHPTSTPQATRRAVTDTVTSLDKALGISLPVFAEVLAP